MTDWKHPNPRTTRLLGLAALVALAVLFALTFLPKRPISRLPPQVQFLGFTHLAAGQIPNTLATNSSFLQEWYASGTNLARFSITNQQRSPVLLYPYVEFLAQSNAQPLYSTLLLSAPNGYGISLQPGQSVTVEVPVLPGRGPGRVLFGYTPDYKHFVPSAIEMVRGLARGKPAGFHTEWFDSPPIQP